MVKFSLLRACCAVFIHNVLFCLLLAGSYIQADNPDVHTSKKTTSAFFFLDNSVSPEGRHFSNTVFLNFLNSNRTDASNVIVMISEERRMNSSTITVNVNKIWNYQLRLPRKSEEFEMVCEEVVSFLRTTVALSNLEKKKSR